MIEGLTLFTLLSAKSWLENTVVETEQCTTKFFKPVFKTSLKAFQTNGVGCVQGSFSLPINILEIISTCSCAKSLQSWPSLCYPADFSPPGPLSMGVCRQEYWSGLPWPAAGDLPHPGIKFKASAAAALQADSLRLGCQESPDFISTCSNTSCGNELRSTVQNIPVKSLPQHMLSVKGDSKRMSTASFHIQPRSELT